MRTLKVGDTIKLAGRSLKGKNKIREHGEMWKVIAVMDNRVRILSNNTNDNRWIAVVGDRNFRII